MQFWVWAGLKTDRALELLAALPGPAPHKAGLWLLMKITVPSIMLPLKLVQDNLRAFCDILILPDAGNSDQNQGSKDSPESQRCFRGTYITSGTHDLFDALFSNIPSLPFIKLILPRPSNTPRMAYFQSVVSLEILGWKAVKFYLKCLS